MVGGITLDSMHAAVAHALTLLDQIPDTHHISGVTFGKFSERADATGYYVYISVTYELGNTKRPEPPYDQRVQRVQLVAEACEEGAARLRERGATGRD
jgi:hypothetical protein